MKNLRFSRSASFSILGLFLSGMLAACVVDKTQEDWRQEQVQQQMSKIATIAGTYNGLISSNQDGAALGSMSLNLRPDTTLQASSNNLSSEQRAIVRGTIAYSGITKANVVFDQGYYDSITGIFKASITIPETNSTMSLYGVVKADRFDGNIEVDGYPTFGGSFSLSRTNAVQTLSPVQSGGRIKALSMEQGMFTGIWNDQGKKKSVGLKITDPSITSEATFLNIFLPTRNLEVSFDFGRYKIFFPNARLDDRSRTLIGQTQIADSSGNARYLVKFLCQIDESAVNWACTISGESNTRATILFSPAPQVNP
jgi:hypothetical protein